MARSCEEKILPFSLWEAFHWYEEPLPSPGGCEINWGKKGSRREFPREFSNSFHWRDQFEGQKFLLPLLEREWRRRWCWQKATRPDTRQVPPTALVYYVYLCTQVLHTHSFRKLCSTTLRILSKNTFRDCERRLVFFAKECYCTT